MPLSSDGAHRPVGVRSQILGEKRQLSRKKKRKTRAQKNPTLRLGKIKATCSELFTVTLRPSQLAGCREYSVILPDLLYNDFTTFPAMAG
jgi:hypothetical protein